MLPQTFFDGDTVEIARSLVGKYLVRQYGGVTLAARVTEAEAYIGRMDKACHAYNYRAVCKIPLYPHPRLDFRNISGGGRRGKGLLVRQFQKNFRKRNHRMYRRYADWRFDHLWIFFLAENRAVP